MIINLKFIEMEFNLKLIPSRKRRVLNEVKTHGRIYGVKLHRELYESDLGKAVAEINQWYGLTRDERWTEHFDSYGNAITAKE